METKPNNVTIVYVENNASILLDLALPLKTTIKEAILISGILIRCPNINLKTHTVGIFSKRKSLDTFVKNGDRIEIYRPLRAQKKLFLRKSLI